MSYDSHFFHTAKACNQHVAEDSHQFFSLHWQSINNGAVQEEISGFSPTKVNDIFNILIQMGWMYNTFATSENNWALP